MERIVETSVEPPWCGRALLDVLSERFTYHGREAWSSRINSGAVVVNARRADPSVELQRGDVITYRVGEVVEPAVASGYSVLLERDGVLAVNKPANLPCHPAGRFFSHTLWAFLKRDLGLARVHFINRLDRETSGIVLVACSPAAARFCRSQSERGAMLKEYLVLVEGRFTETIAAKGWLQQDESSPVRKKRRFVPTDQETKGETHPGAVWAETWLEPVHCHGSITLVKAVLGTGRTHQIRATLCSLGFPVIGDKLYGVDQTMFLRFIDGALTADDDDRLRLKRQALHAWKTAFRLPTSSEVIHLEAPLPADMAAWATP